MFDHVDGVMRGLARKKTQWKEDLFFAVKLVQQKLSKYDAEVPPPMSMDVVCAHILDFFQKLWSCRISAKGIDSDPEEETSDTTQYQDAFFK